MAYPTDIIATSALVDKGISTTETQTIALIGAQKLITLDYRAKGQEVLSDGIISPSSLVVVQGGALFSEVFTLPVPAGRYFYHQDDAVNQVSKLVFENGQSGDVTVTYTTKGSIIKAATVNGIQNDLRTVETVLGTGVVRVLSGVTATIDTDYDIDLEPYGVTDAATAVVIVTPESPSDITITRLAAVITITPNPTGVALNYLVVVK